ncbi:Carbohydrate binding module (family 35) [Fibrobacter sp. UWT2]|uniref:glycosyl hydrolase n=1 Tax=Fibrobacter sp. UWT2 TaxID=1896224 RepID=UPI00090F3AB4|nr:glycosyl hydrolase [Fibrobacter sp. UWT2]SHL81755.1 Carbohydrate binding module (family 35) [Fibrobacter sp. UWT2]
MFKRYTVAILAATLATTAFATKYEAESATVSSEAKIVNSSGVSGTGYASLQEGTITFTGVTVETAGKYTLTIRYKAGDFKANYLKVNGATAGTIDFAATTGWADVTTAVTLKAGTNTIAIEKYWGWIDVDYIDISAYESAPFKLSATPVTPNATESAVKLYNFLRENFGKKTISGIMTGDMSGYTQGADFKTHDDVKYIYTRTGKYPALVGLDFLFATGPNASGSWNMEYTDKAISIAKGLWKAGGIPAFTWHWKDPLDKKDAFYIQSAAGTNEYTDFDFSTGFKSGTTEWDTESAAYKGIIADIDHIADYFLELQKEGVAGIFRPLHEAGGKWFWWSINSGKQFAALYRLVYDRMVNVKGVRNMVWVYNPSTDDVNGWDPGDSYYDVLGIDIYNRSGDNSSNAASFDGLKAKNKGKKILALTENGPIPDVAKMHEDVSVWSWWMPWYHTWNSKFIDQTPDAVWKSNMEDDRILTLDKMPGWDKYKPNQDTSTTRLAKVSPFYGPATTIGIFDMNGHYVGLTTQGLPQGRYIVRQRIQGRNLNAVYIKK